MIIDKFNQLINFVSIQYSNVNAAAIATPRVKRKLPPRTEQVKTLQSGEEYDVIIIGGGATGAGCALDAITRGTFYRPFFGP